MSLPDHGLCGANGTVIDAARDLMHAGDRLRATIGWADHQVAALETRWARNRAARARPDGPERPDEPLPARSSRERA